MNITNIIRNSSEHLWRSSCTRCQPPAIIIKTCQMRTVPLWRSQLKLKLGGKKQSKQIVCHESKLESWRPSTQTCLKCPFNCSLLSPSIGEKWAQQSRTSNQTSPLFRWPVFTPGALPDATYSFLSVFVTSSGLELGAYIPTQMLLLHYIFVDTLGISWNGVHSDPKVTVRPQDVFSRLILINNAIDESPLGTVTHQSVYLSCFGSGCHASVTCSCSGGTRPASAIHSCYGAHPVAATGFCLSDTCPADQQPAATTCFGITQPAPSTHSCPFCGRHLFLFPRRTSWGSHPIPFYRCITSSSCSGVVHKPRLPPVPFSGSTRPAAAWGSCSGSAHPAATIPFLFRWRMTCGRRLSFLCATGDDISPFFWFSGRYMILLCW